MMVDRGFLEYAAWDVGLKAVSISKAILSRSNEWSLIRGKGRGSARQILQRVILVVSR